MENVYKAIKLIVSHVCFSGPTGSRSSLYRNGRQCNAERRAPTRCDRYRELRASQCFIAVNLKLGYEPPGDHGNTDSSIRGRCVLKGFFALKFLWKPSHGKFRRCSRLRRPGVVKLITILLTFLFWRCSPTSVKSCNANGIPKRI